MKLTYFILIILVAIVIPSAFAEFNLQSDGVFYKITGMTESKTYYHALTDGNMTLLQGERKITPANNDAIMPLPYQNSPGIYIWNWYENAKKTILADTISWNLYDTTLEKKEISEISISVSTEFSQYLEGETIVIFGTVTPREWGIPVIIQVVNEDNQLVRVSQIIPNQDGSYETSLIAQGVTLNKHQKIMVRANYLDEMSTTDFEFIPREKIPIIKPLQEPQTVNLTVYEIVIERPQVGDQNYDIFADKNLSTNYLNLKTFVLSQNNPLQTLELTHDKIHETLLLVQTELLDIQSVNRFNSDGTETDEYIQAWITLRAYNDINRIIEQIIELNKSGMSIESAFNQFNPVIIEEEETWPIEIIDVKILDDFGNEVNTINVDQQIQFASSIKNKLPTEQKFIYFLKIVDESENIDIRWITGTLTADQIFVPTQSWVPDKIGSYTAYGYLSDLSFSLNVLHSVTVSTFNVGGSTSMITIIDDKKTNLGLQVIQNEGGDLIDLNQIDLDLTPFCTDIIFKDCVEQIITKTVEPTIPPLNLTLEEKYEELLLLVTQLENRLTILERFHVIKPEPPISPPISPPTHIVSVPAGSAVPGCEETNSCFIPYELTIDNGDTVSWSNDDSAAHTITAGTVFGLSGIFDSGLFLSGATFSHTFKEPGTYPYFCMVHPWQEGMIIVN